MNSNSMNICDGVDSLQFSHLNCHHTIWATLWCIWLPKDDLNFYHYYYSSRNARLRLLC